MVLRTANVISFQRNMINIALVFLCFFISPVSHALLHEDVQGESVHCPQILSFSQNEPELTRSLKAQLGIGATSELLIKKKKMRLTHSFSKRGHYVFTDGKVSKINLEGRVSRMECHYSGSGGSYTVTVMFESDFAYRLSHSFFASKGDDYCYGYDPDAPDDSLFCSVSPFYTVFLNQVHHTDNLQAKLNIVLSNGLSHSIEAGGLKAVPYDGYVQLFLQGYFRPYDVTAGCEGGSRGFILLNPLHAAIYQLRGILYHNRFEHFACDINPEKNFSQKFERSWEQTCDGDDCERRRQKSKPYWRTSGEEQQYAGGSGHSKENRYEYYSHQYQKITQPQSGSVIDDSWLSFRLQDLYYWYIRGESDNEVGQAFFNLGMWPDNDLHAVKKNFRAMAKKSTP